MKGYMSRRLLQSDYVFSKTIELTTRHVVLEANFATTAAPSTLFVVSVRRAIIACLSKKKSNFSYFINHVYSKVDGCASGTVIHFFLY